MSTSSEDECDCPIDYDHDLKCQLLSCLDDVRSGGSFAAFDVIDNFVNPGISIDPIGIIGLPLSESDALALIQLSHRAPFSNGNETLVDETVRKTWEISASQVRFLNTEWNNCLRRIVEQAAKDLGIPDGSEDVHAEFYKMLVYEKGAMFKVHKDTEKVRGMFGTLVICLPSEHTGGTVCLQHGKQHARFDTSDFSAFNASFIAWYADVSHEIEPVQTGCRWVLTYNLVYNFREQDQSISIDARIGRCRQILSQWQAHESKPQFLAYQLEHQYTINSLRLAELKGNDYYRAHFVAQSLAEYPKFFLLFAHMNKHINDNNDQDTMIERWLYLARVVGRGGRKFHNHSLYISQEYLLREISHDDGEPDVQRGGEYCGNQDAEIDEFFNDSVMILVPECFIAPFLLGGGESQHHLGYLLERLQESEDPDSQDIQYHIFESMLSKKYSTESQKVLCLARLAVGALMLPDASLFDEVVEQDSKGFDKEAYCQLRKLLRRQIQDIHMREDNYLEVLKKCPNLHEAHDNLDSFHHRFFEGNPGRKDPLDVRHFNRWLDARTIKVLDDLKEVRICASHASILLQIIRTRDDDKFRQFVLYQGVRVFVERFLHNDDFINALFVELLLDLGEPGSSQNFFESLIQIILEPAIANFSLARYATYIWTRSRGATYIWSRLRVRDDHAGPIKTIYERACVHDQGKPSRLLRKIGNQASEFSNEQTTEFLMSLLEELLAIVDTSSAETRECIQSLVTTHITKNAGKEPEQPTDWARPEEVNRCPKNNCNECSEMEGFLLNPETKTHRFPNPLDSSWNDHLHVYTHHFRYLKLWKDNDGKIVSVTKTSKHQKWESRYNKTLEALRKLPQDKLKQCLGHHYDEIMDLRIVKVDKGPTESGSSSTERGLYPTTPIVAQKRPREDS